MPSSEIHSSPLAFTTFRHQTVGIRNDHIHSMEPNEESRIQDAEIQFFQEQIFNLFHDLLATKDDKFLSIAWVRKLLDGFTSCLENFRVILTNNRAQFSKPPTDRLVSDLFDRSIKALDFCNAIRDGIEKLRHWEKHLEIVATALDSRQRMMGEGQFRRARKALMDLAFLTLDEKDTGSVFSRRNRSFGRHLKNKDTNHHQSGHSRSLSWSVSQSWSATKQLQSIANNLIPPRGNDVAPILVYTVNFVLMFVLWALVAAIPCQDRSLNIHFTFPRQNLALYSWSNPLYLLHSRIVEESKKRDRQNSCGLLKEICQIEKCVQQITELVDSIQFPLTEERKEEVRASVKELSPLCQDFKTALDPLERLLREVFRKIMSCRTEGLEILGRASEP